MSVNYGSLMISEVRTIRIRGEPMGIKSHIL